MESRTHIPVIDHETCTGCGACVDICPREVLALRDGRIVTTVDECMVCSHCYCVCPEGAISFHPDAVRNLSFSSFQYGEAMIRPGEADPAYVVNLFRSRRSVRRFHDRPVPDPVISDLVEFAISAPSGSNCQEWRFTALNGRDRVWGLAREIGGFFRKINRMAGNPLIRYLAVPFMGTALVRYYNNNYESVERGLAEAEKGRDLLFHGAPAVVIIHGEADGSSPSEDAQFASYNMTILAHALGLGTCYIGYAVEAMNRSEAARRYAGIPENHRIHGVLAVGYPRGKFIRQALRKPVVDTRPGRDGV